MLDNTDLKRSAFRTQRIYTSLKSGHMLLGVLVGGEVSRGTVGGRELSRSTAVGQPSGTIEEVPLRP